MISSPRLKPEPDDASAADRLVVTPEQAGFPERFGALLARRGLVDAPGLLRARRAAESAGERFDTALVKLGLISEDDLAGAYAAYCGLPLVEAAAAPKQAVLPERLKPAFLKANRLLPLEVTDARLHVAMADPFNEEALRAIDYKLDRRIERAVVTPGDFETVFAALYGTEVKEAAVAAPALQAFEVADLDIERLRDIANEAPIIRLVNQLIARASERRASDIHIEPGRDAVTIRFRVDGVLQTEQTVEPQLRAALTTRIKIMAGLDIAERRLPQDGRIKSVVRGVEIDIRVSTLPTAFGETVVMRLLDRSRVDLVLDRIGLTEGIHHDLRGLLGLSHGIVLVTGPTGSGKTTTLYAALGAIGRPGLKVVTVEDPVEYQIATVSQVQVQPQIGFDFPRALRSILRQDPDVIMIGEIRDLETASIAIQAALTGHLVLSTLHTNDAVSSVTRLIDIGVEPYLLGATVAGVMAQRLVRRLCPACARPDPEAAPLLIDALGSDRHCVAVDPVRLRGADGCESCRGTGFSGRLVIGEMVVVDDAFRAAIAAGHDQQRLAALARRHGRGGLRTDGLRKVAAGETTLAEVLRVTSAS